MNIWKKVKSIFTKKKKFSNLVVSGSDFSLFINDGESVEEDDDRRGVRPVDIVHLLESGVNVDLNNLKENLKVLKKRVKFYEKVSLAAPYDVTRAIDMLEARLKFPKKSCNFVWKTTTHEKIDALTEKYKLDHKDISEFLHRMPDEAVKEAVNFCNAVETVSNIPPELSVIAPPKFFVQRRGDPILLGKSPFGEYYYILCAWDKEVEVVDQLLSGERLKRQ